ncbi:MAG TPA: 2-C-methyl-D-erythritol 2,4-cyclodiphosphate synthase [Ruminococcaceae bacterium]|jgi:2-C-methyl-D-erythritol 2,4-cyclodiphosphate synthase|nr:2-C-methyl-D-erythritol 2,4-cyclodiphosphate synthase [Oscillospiraceae bacterium]
MRIGHGYDVHRLVKDRKLILGGVDIPFDKGLLGHSDADVLTHAITDALLGAAAMGDIGEMFPDTDNSYLNANSIEFLQFAVETIKLSGWRIGNIDATVIVQAPKLKPYTQAMRFRIANACSIDITQVSIKATTEEHLGFSGAGQGIAAHAVCLLHAAD